VPKIPSVTEKYLFLLTAPARSSAWDVRFFVIDTVVVAGFSVDSVETSASTTDWPATEFCCEVK